MNNDQPKNLTHTKPPLRCAIYTRKSREEGLEQQFNSLDAQRLAAEQYIASQQHEGWILSPESYNDGGFSGGNIERPRLKRLFHDIQENKIDCIVVYKIDRLTRSLLDFASIISLLEAHQVNFVSITESFNTATPMGRLVLNVLLCFAQYERELAGERVRDKIDAAKKQGLWMGGNIPMGYDSHDSKLVVNKNEANVIELIYQRFLETHSITAIVQELHDRGFVMKSWVSKRGNQHGGHAFDKKNVRRILDNPLYAGKMTHKGEVYQGQHEAIIDEKTWQKAQTIFKRKSQPHQLGNRLTSLPLLQGLIQCGHCKGSMIPTYTNKRAKRYRYYLCDKKHKGKNNDCPIVRLSADEIEALVVDKITKLLKQPELIATTIAESRDTLTESEVIKALQSVECVWSELFPIEQSRIITLLVKSITVNTNGVELKLYKQGLYSLSDELGEAKHEC